MPELKIVINSTEDALNGKGIIDPTVNKPDSLKPTDDITFGIIEKGTVGGQPVLMVILKDAEGNNHVGQITANMFVTLVGAWNGAMERFKM